MDCVFCKIVEGNISSIRVYEDDKTLAFMDINPVNDGHTLVVPKKHSANILEITEEDIRAVAATARKVALAVDKALSPEGMNLMQSNGRVAGQEVFHFHMHVMPRWQGDRSKLDWRLARGGDTDRIKDVAEKIKAQL